MESDRIHAAGAIMREAVNTTDAPGAEQGWLDWLAGHGVPGITGVDTRALVRHIRTAGAMRGGIFPAAMPEAEARDRVLAEPSDGRARPRARGDAARAAAIEGEGGGLRIVALDTGIKRSIVRNFVARGVQLELYPCTTPADELLARDPDGFFLVPGPGRPGGARLPRRHDPRAARAQAGVRDLPRPPAARRARRAWRRSSSRSATAAPTTRSRTCATGRIAITSQNHGFAVAGEPGARASSPTSGAAELTHVNLYDGTVEGFRLLDVPAACVQYHPEAGPGPNDSLGLFDDFVGRVRRVPRRDDLQQDPRARLGADRDRPGGRVRLLRRPGLQGAAGGGLRGRARELQPGDDHDRPGVRDRDLRRAAAARAGARR